MKATEKIRIKARTYLKNYFFINLFAIEEPTPQKEQTDSFNNGAEENCSLNFEEYKELYMTRCRWS